MKRNGEMVMPPHNGDVAGAKGSFGNAGPSTGVTDTYGADISGDAINRQGSIAASTKSDPAFNCYSKRSTKE